MQSTRVNNKECLHSNSCQGCFDIRMHQDSRVVLTEMCVGSFHSKSIYSEHNVLYESTSSSCIPPPSLPSFPLFTVNSVEWVPVSPSTWELMARFAGFASRGSGLSYELAGNSGRSCRSQAPNLYE